MGCTRLHYRRRTLLHNVYNLMKRLCDAGFILNVETGGSLSTEFVDPRVHIILDIKYTQRHAA